MALTHIITALLMLAQPVVPVLTHTRPRSPWWPGRLARPSRRSLAAKRALRTYAARLSARSRRRADP